MNDQLIQSLPLLATAALAPILIVLTLPRRYAPGAKPFLILEIGVAVWALAYAFSFLDNQLTDKIFWNKVAYSGFAILPGAWLALALQYSGKDRWLSPRYIALLAVDPVVRITLAWTNDAHGLVWGPATLDTTGAVEVLSQTYGPVFLIGLAYAYTLIIIGVWVYLREFLRSQQIYLGQAIAVLTAVLLPGAVLLAFLLGLRPLSYDVTPFATAIANSVLLWGFFGTRFFDVVPVARDLIIEDMSEGVIVLDPHGRVIGLNRSAGLMIGQAPGNVIGHQATEALAVLAPQLDITLSGQDAPSEVRLNIDGREHWYELRVLPIPIRGARGLGHLIMMHDTTQRKAAEESLSLRNWELDTLLRLASMFARPGSFEEKAALVVDELGRTTGADSVTLRLHNEEAGGLRLVARAGDQMFSDRPLIQNAPKGLSVAAFEAGVPVVANDYPSHPYAEASAVAQGSRSMASLPVKVGEHTLGVITVVSREPDHFNSERVGLLTAVADGLGVLLENARLAQNLEASREEMAVVDEVARIMTSTLDIHQVYERFAQEVRKLVDFDAMGICTVDESKDTFTLDFLIPETGPSFYQGQTVALEGSFNGYTIKEGTTLVVDDFAEETRFKTQDLLVRHGIRSGVSLPLTSKERTFGSFALFSQRPNAYGRRDQVILERLANQIAPAVENAILYQRAEQLALAAATIGDGVCITDLEGNIQFVNPALERMLGYDPGELVDEPVSRLYPGGPDDPVLAQILAGLETGQWFGEAELLAKSGEVIPTLETATPMNDRGGRSVGYVCVNTDIREGKRAAAEQRTLEIRALAQSKLATLGEVATGVAHEINQPLTYISTLIQSLQEDLELDDLDPERVQARLAEGGRQVSRITNIVDHLRTFGRREDTEMAEVNLAKVLDSTLLLVGEKIRLRNIELERRVDEDLPPVWGNANQLEQVYINLFQNSIDALAETQQAKITVSIHSSPGQGQVVLAFSDNGVGIPPAYVEKVFEPFFTTKQAGQGTGLGLSIIYGIIMDHRGTIGCESEYTKGTTITISVPIMALELRQRNAKE